MKIDFTKKFIKEQAKLSASMQVRFDIRLKLFLNNPFHPQLNNHSLRPPYAGCRSINISGDFRAIYEQHEDYVLFVHIGTHSELYE